MEKETKTTKDAPKAASPPSVPHRSFLKKWEARLGLIAAVCFLVLAAGVYVIKSYHLRKLEDNPAQPATVKAIEEQVETQVLEKEQAAPKALPPIVDVQLETGLVPAQALQKKQEPTPPAGRDTALIIPDASSKAEANSLVLPDPTLPPIPPMAPIVPQVDLQPPPLVKLPEMSETVPPAVKPVESLNFNKSKDAPALMSSPNEVIRPVQSVTQVKKDPAPTMKLDIPPPVNDLPPIIDVPPENKPLPVPSSGVKKSPEPKPTIPSLKIDHPIATPPALEPPEPKKKGKDTEIVPPKSPMVTMPDVEKLPPPPPDVKPNRNDPPTIKLDVPLSLDPPAKKDTPPAVIQFAPKKPERGNGGEQLAQQPSANANDYDEDLHSQKPKDSYRSISKQYYNSDAYASALRHYNLDHPGRADYVRIPPIWVLEKRYSPDLANTTPARAVNYSPPPAVETSLRPNQYYTVSENGEMLADIARKALGNENAWKRIWDFNSQINPARLIPGGTRLRLPDGSNNP